MVVMYSGPRNPETQGGRPRKFDPRTRPDPEKQTPNQPRHQPILNFTLKISRKPEGDVPEMLIPKPELIPTQPRLLHLDYITNKNTTHSTKR